MDFRVRRQLAVIALIALVAGGIGFWVFRASAPAPSCQDSRRNQGEEETDCGGPCVSCAFRSQRDLEVFWVRFVQTRENTYDAVAEVRNPNVKLGAPSFEYEFRLFDAAGVAVASRRGTAFIYPGETIHLAAVGLTSGRAIREAALRVGGTAWVLTDAIGPDVAAGNKEYSLEDADGRQVSVVRAVVTNRATLDLAPVEVTALALDTAGNLAGVHQTQIGVLPAGGREAVRLVWPEAFPSPPSALIIEARSHALFPRPGR